MLSGRGCFGKASGCGVRGATGVLRMPESKDPHPCPGHLDLARGLDAGLQHIQDGVEDNAANCQSVSESSRQWPVTSCGGVSLGLFGSACCTRCDMTSDFPAPGGINQPPRCSVSVRAITGTTTHAHCGRNPNSNSVPWAVVPAWRR